VTVRTVLVTIVGPAGAPTGTAGMDASVRDGPQPRRDLSLPADVPLGELLPTLVRLFGGPGARTSGYWTLATADGSTLRADVPLGANGILNGALLQLQHVQARPAVVVELPSQPPPAPPVPQPPPPAPVPIQWDEPVEPAARAPARAEAPASALLAEGQRATAWPPPGPVPPPPLPPEPEPPEPVGHALDELEPVVPIGSRRWREEVAPVPDDPGQGNGLTGGGFTNGGLANGGLANGLMAIRPTANDPMANGLMANGAPAGPDRDAASAGGWGPAARTWDARPGAWREDGGHAPGHGGAGRANGSVNGHLDGTVDGIVNGTVAGIPGEHPRVRAGGPVGPGVAVRGPAPAPPGPLARARRALRSADSPRHLDAAIAAPRLRRGVTVAVISPKPGSGRTTVTALLASTLVELRPDQVRVVAHPHAPSRRAAQPAEVVALGGVVLLDCVAGLDASAARGAIGAADQLVVVTDADPATGSLVVEAALPLIEAGRSVTLVVNQRPLRGRRLDVRRLQQMLPHAGGPVLLPYEPAAGAALDQGRFTLGDAPAAWRRAARELAFILTADWRARGCAR